MKCWENQRRSTVVNRGNVAWNGLRNRRLLVRIQPGVLGDVHCREIEAAIAGVGLVQYFGDLAQHRELALDTISPPSECRGIRGLKVVEPRHRLVEHHEHSLASKVAHAAVASPI